MTPPTPHSDAPADVQAALTRMRANDPAMRCAALEQLTDRAPAEVVDRVAARALTDSDAGVREEAARWLMDRAMASAATEVAPQIASDNITTRNLAGEVLAEMGAVAVSPLLRYLDDPDPHVRKFTLDVLAQIPTAAEIVEVIAARLRDEDDNVRLAAIAALGQLGASEYADALAALYDDTPLARPDIVHAMGAFGPEADLELLERALSDDNPVVQLAAAEALASHDAPGVLDLLLRQVEAVDPMARPIVLSSIVERMETRPEPAPALPEALKSYLLDMLSDPSADYRQAAARGLRYFSDEQTVESMLAHAGQDDALDVELFDTLLQHPEPFAPLRRATSSNRIDEGAAATFTLGLLAQDAISAPALRQIGGFLQRHFHTLSADDKMTAIHLCQQMDRPELRPVLDAAQSDPDPSISAFADDVAPAHS